MDVKFTYTSEIHTPKHLAGKAGETKELDIEDAKKLESQGYGHIEVESTSHTEDSDSADVPKPKRLKSKAVKKEE